MGGAGREQAGEQGRGESRWVLFASLRCLDSTLRVVRELLKELKQEWNLTKCAFLIYRSLCQQLDEQAGGLEGGDLEAGKAFMRF